MADEELYAWALKEFDENPDKGFLGKAIVRAKGNEERVKAEYISLRVSELRADLSRQARVDAANARAISAASKAKPNSPANTLRVDKEKLALLAFIVVLLLASIVSYRLWTAVW